MLLGFRKIFLNIKYLNESIMIVVLARVTSVMKLIQNFSHLSSFCTVYNV